MPALAGGEEATQTVSALLTWTLIILTPAAVLAFLGAGSYGSVFAKPSCSASAETIAALLVMFVPQIWFYGLAVVSAGVLQAHGRFLAAALAPLLSSVVVITSYLLFATVAAPGCQRRPHPVDQAGGTGTRLRDDARRAHPGRDHADPDGAARSPAATAVAVRRR